MRSYSSFSASLLATWFSPRQTEICFALERMMARPTIQPICASGAWRNCTPIFPCISRLMSTLSRLPRRPRNVCWLGLALQEPHKEEAADRRGGFQGHLADVLEGFADDPAKSNEPRLEAIQMAWHEEFEDALGKD